MKTILITGIGGLTPRSIAKIIKEKHPDYKLIGCDVDKKAIGFFMKTKDGRQLIDEYFIALWSLRARSLNGGDTMRSTENILVQLLWGVGCCRRALEIRP